MHQNTDLFQIKYHSKEKQKESQEISIWSSAEEEISKLSEKKKKKFLNNSLSYYIAA